MALRIYNLKRALKDKLSKLDQLEVKPTDSFDTIKVLASKDVITGILKRAQEEKINLLQSSPTELGISLDETCYTEDVDKILAVFSNQSQAPISDIDLYEESVPESLMRKTTFLENNVFNSYHSETELLRYITRLEKKDLSLNHSMIPLGSCTMKLNATSEMIPVTWEHFGNIHPFAPNDQTLGYRELIDDLENTLCEITGFDSVSFQPNAGSQGEYAGLLVIRQYLRDQGQGQRNICLIPSSAHGTNPASAVMAGMKVVVVQCDDKGNIDLNDLKSKADQHKNELAALMVTYPSTHGVFESSIKEICSVVHEYGGQVYLDGANLNALVGVSQIEKLGADVAHMNLHKTFCIPHGGGGPGVGPIGVAKHLSPYIPSHRQNPSCGPEKGTTAVSAAPWGSASILPISWGYTQMMGREGLKKATQIAILNANYIAKKLEPHFPILFTGENGWIAHECIIDVRPLKDQGDITVDDIAKRLMDYGFHAPTMSWPVAGTLMIEPTESESLAELDRFCEALINIRKEADDVISGKVSKEDNVLKNSPHSIGVVTGTEWNHSYSRETAAYPLPWVRERKFWTPVNRVDNAFGDRNLVCTCPSIEEYQ